MAQVACCPQCEHESIIPDGIAADAWAKCPECRAFFRLKEAKTRELPAVLLVEPDPEELEKQSAPTVADLSSVATWVSDAPEELEASAAEVEEEELEAETLAFETPAPESPDVAAQRIDAWFRSAKTLPDLPSVAENPATETGDELGDEPVDEPAISAATSATIELGEHGMGDFASSDDFERETPADSPQDIATWDDSQHMERLLAGIQKEPIDEFSATGGESLTEHSEEHIRATGAWSPDESVSVAPRADKPRRKRSLLRTLVVTAFGGIVGLGLGYYALLWIRGPEIDFLEVAQYLPKSILPPSFHTKPRELAAATAIRPSAEAAPTEVADDVAAPATEAPAEKQTAFTEPAKSIESSAPADDRYKTAATEAAATGIETSDPVSELAPPAETAAATEPNILEAPAAQPLAEEPKPAEMVHVAGAPSFKPEELNAALQAARIAQPNLIKGSLADGKEVQQAKGKSYNALADLAQQATFVEAAGSESVIKSRQEADDLFRQTLADAQTRSDIAQIVPKWLSYPKRPHGGIFFAGSVTSHAGKGSVVECSIDLGSGQPLTVLVPAAMAGQLEGSSSPIVVAGWIADRPAEHVTGYTGSAPQAVFAGRLIPLQ